MRTKSSWETCSGNIMLWMFSLLSVTSSQMTSQHFRCVRTLRTHRTLQMLLLPLNLRSFTDGYHHLGCAAVLGRNLLCHNELALSQSVRSLQSSIKWFFWTVHIPFWSAMTIFFNLMWFLCFFLCCRHQRKLKAIVAGSAGEKKLGERTTPPPVSVVYRFM